MLAAPIFKAIIALLGLACAGCTVHFFWCCLRQPSALFYIRRQWQGPSRTQKIAGYAYIGCVWIGVGYCIFRGTQAALQIIPRDWVAYSEDGDPIWIGNSIAATVALLGSVWLIETLEKLSIKFVGSEQQRRP